MEEETGFVSSGSTKLPTLLAHLLHDLNTHRKSTLVGAFFFFVLIFKVQVTTQYTISFLKFTIKNFVHFNFTVS